jgi:hypothetical protein
MRTPNQLLICGSLLTFLANIPACRQQSNSLQSAASQPAATTEIVGATWPNPIRYVQCDEKDAETVLTVTVTVRNVVAGQEFAYPLKPKKEYDEHGLLEMPTGPMGTIVCADGSKNGHGTGYVASASLTDGTDKDVTVSIRFSWTAADNTRGKIDREVRIPVGRPLDQQLSKMVSIKARFKPGPVVR